MNTSKKSKVVVTGGAGFIGSHAVDLLVNEGFLVHVIDNLCAGDKKRVNPKAKLHVVDITDPEAISPIIKGAQYVFHFAALPRVQYSIEHPKETNEVNVEGTLNVLMASVAGGVKRVIYSASSSAYGDQDTLPLIESMTANPKSPYGLQKYIGELYCRVWSMIYGIETVSLRYFNVYGPRQSAEGAYALVIAKFLKQRQEGQSMTITGTGKQTRDFTHVSDVARANFLAAVSTKVGKGEVLNIGAGRNFSVNQVAKLIGGPIAYIPARIEPKDTKASNILARKMIGWKPERKFEEGIAELKKLAGMK
jgi:UDP-glucose 4-epimerase